MDTFLKRQVKRKREESVGNGQERRAEASWDNWGPAAMWGRRRRKQELWKRGRNASELERSRNRCSGWKWVGRQLLRFLLHLLALLPIFLFALAPCLHSLFSPSINVSLRSFCWSVAISPILCCISSICVFVSSLRSAFPFASFVFFLGPSLSTLSTVLLVSHFSLIQNQQSVCFLSLCVYLCTSSLISLCCLCMSLSVLLCMSVSSVYVCVCLCARVGVGIRHGADLSIEEKNPPYDPFIHPSIHPFTHSFIHFFIRGQRCPGSPIWVSHEPNSALDE